MSSGVADMRLWAGEGHAIEQAGRRLLRHPRPGARGGASELEEEGHRILKLNIGNPAPFGFEAPDEILAGHRSATCRSRQGYSDSQGLLSARTAVVQHYQEQGMSTA